MNNRKIGVDLSPTTASSCTKQYRPMISPESIGKALSETVETAIKSIKTIAETPAADHAGHKLIEHGLDVVRESIDIDDDGSILDTVPELIEAGVKAISSMFD